MSYTNILRTDSWQHDKACLAHCQGHVNHTAPNTFLHAGKHPALQFHVFFYILITALWLNLGVYSVVECFDKGGERYSALLLWCRSQIICYCFLLKDLYLALTDIYCALSIMTQLLVTFLCYVSILICNFRFLNIFFQTLPICFWVQQPHIENS